MTVEDARLAARLAEAAGALLLELRGEQADSVDGKALGRLGDARSNAYLLGQLATLRPEDAVLSEESADDKSRLDRHRVWIVDPLDGTREYSLPARADWAVHVALWQDGEITAAAVAQPALGVVYASDAASPPTSPLPEVPRVLVSDSRPPGFAPRVAEALGGKVASMGSAGAKAMAVLRGDAEAYVHAGGQWEWDSAAPVGVAQAAGLHCSRIDGSPLRYNQSHPYLPDLVICRPELAPPILAAIAG
ncbi:MAG: 3'(2'),5'-bisphosphate nucleotidase CysQ [Aldersonia sp.]|nr:3'(2'),5'-bisphosphate nucleotidase CysQ [Aldersonia sp.]